MVAETINPDGWIPLENKYDARCKSCGENISVGVNVLWKKGTGIRHEKCEPPKMEEPKKLIDKKEWKDYKQYPYKQLREIKNCQCCGVKLYGDIFINDDRRTCEEHSNI